MLRCNFWGLYVSSVLILVACGGDSKPDGTIVNPSGGAANGGGGGSGGAGGSNGGTGSFIEDFPDAGGVGGCAGACSGDAGPASLCGNAVLNEGEFCDDGNRAPGDGCTGQCNLEPNFQCTSAGQQCESTIVCGDGAIGGNEACDDGDREPGDGCNADCAVESGFGCSTASGGGSLCTPLQVVECGDGIVSAGEQCDDDGIAPGDGCSELCQVEGGFVCPTAGAPCELIERCGDGFLKDDEGCDDGNLVPFDGCNNQCQLENNFQCPTPGQLCQSTIVCGDGVITGNENCDDGVIPPVGGDGCSAICTEEPGFDCANGTTPKPCELIPEERCGDNRVAPNEFCDNGETSGDGCSAACTIEPGFVCSGEPSVCVPVSVCGDSLVDGSIGESCDDGGTCDGGANDGLFCNNGDGCPDGECEPAGGDGCTANCRVEVNFACPNEVNPAGGLRLGGACSSTIVCGDGVATGDETCDVAGAGCADCQVQAGFICSTQAGVCVTECGDGIVAGSEQCDDGGTAPGNGCGPDCRLEDGFKCDDPGGDPAAPDVCSPTTCGQFGREGTEQCDDGNDVPYDGCFECRNEVECGDAGAGYACDAVCGDGMKFPLEACDDGNTVSGDGCSATCQLELGFECDDAAPDLGSSLDLPIIYRDFSDAHPQFEIDGSGLFLQGMVADTLAADGRPVLNPAFEGTSRCGGELRLFTLDGPTGFATPPGGGTPACNTRTLNAADAATTFLQWYHDDPANAQIVDFISLAEVGPVGSGIFQCADDDCFGGDTGNQFFPLNDRGFGNEGRANNFHFTSEVRQAFVFEPGSAPTLTFRGDDDVWVYVNGQLTVDLGGIHGERTGRIVIDGASSELCVGPNGQDVADFDLNPGTFCETVDLTLDPDLVNEVAVFQAERHVTQSNYTLTIEGFNAPITSCLPVCGDGVVTAGEACDLGTANNNGSYEGCNPDCTLASRCGDLVVDAGEEDCDNGVNIDLRDLGGDECAPGCVTPSSCGDGQVDGAFGEVCDLGPGNNTGEYAGCNVNCTLAPRCGDGAAQAGEGEQCDDGNQNGAGGSLCQTDCTLRCGNGTVDQGEACDDGGANAPLGTYEACQVNCQLGPRCGDGFTDASFGEQCDDGLNDGAYGTCAPSCVLGPFCGDGDAQVGFGEICDEGGANVQSGYAPNLCTTQCRPAPFCGDSQVNVSNSEVCDDGVNDGSPGGCASDCRSSVPLASCGDGVVNAGEACDDGSAVNGSLQSACDPQCRLKCGNGFVNEGEQCDDGVNSGAYGTCNPNCSFAPFCGDGTTNPQEACDDGSSNVEPQVAYGNGLCTTACVVAPTCGDGRIDTQFGESCDGSPGCSNACRPIQ